MPNNFQQNIDWELGEHRLGLCGGEAEWGSVSWRCLCVAGGVSVWLEVPVCA